MQAFSFIADFHNVNMSFMRGKIFLTIEEATDVILNHDFEEAQMILLPPPGDGDEYINDEQVIDDDPCRAPNDVAGEVEVLIKNMRDIASLQSESDIDFKKDDSDDSIVEVIPVEERKNEDNVDSENDDEVISLEKSEDGDNVVDGDVSSESDVDDDILITDLIRGEVHKTRLRKSEEKLESNVLDEILGEVEREGYDMKMNGENFDTSLAEKKPRRQKQQTRKRRFDVTDVRFVPHKEKPRKVPPSRKLATPKGGRKPFAKKNVTPIWKKTENIRSMDEGMEIGNLADAHPEITNMQPSDFFQLFFTPEYVEEIADLTNQYALQQGVTLNTDAYEMLKFFGILIISGYHTLPGEDSYWSTAPDLKCDAVSNTMSRKRFRSLKRYAHFVDNTKLDKNDKYAKVRPLYDQLNEQLVQFGVFSEHLSIDESMVPYFGNHNGNYKSSILPTSRAAYGGS